jgi:type II secretory pathway pseudopilin PulG
LAGYRPSAHRLPGACPAAPSRREYADRESGFSLLEVLFAATVLTVALAGLAQLFAVATRANSSARATTYAAILALQKMEQLRNLTYAFDPLGLPRTDLDTDITVVPELPSGGTGLQPSPAGALGANTVGYVDYLDANGTSLGGLATIPPPGAVYIRRWSVEPLPINPNNTIVLQVLVTRTRNRGRADNADGVVTRLPDEARFVTVKTRKAP